MLILRSPTANPAGADASPSLLLLIDRDARAAVAGGGADRSDVHSPQPELDRDPLERILRDIGASVRTVHLPHASAEIIALPGLPALPAEEEILVIACADPGALLIHCLHARAAAPEVVLLACLLSVPPGGADPLLCQRILEAGADDILLGLPDRALIQIRLLQSQRTAAVHRNAQRAARHAQALSDLLALFSDPHRSSASSDQSPLPGDGVPTPEGRGLMPLLHRLVHTVHRAAGWDRAALLLLGEDGEGLTAVAFSDDPERGPLPLPAGGADLSALRAALRAGAPLLLPGPDPDDAPGDSILLSALYGTSPDSGPRELTDRGPLLLVPILVPETAARDGHDGLGGAAGPALWALLLQRATPLHDLPDPLREFLGLSAQIAALGLRGRRAIESVRDQTRRFSLPRLAAERRREAALQYRDFFETSADGVMVLDSECRVIYLSRIAEQITGYAAAGLSGHSIGDFLPHTQRAGLQDAVRKVLSGLTLQPFDMQLRTTSGEMLVLSVSTSAVLSRAGCAVLLFRDVTDQRVLEYELRHTKEFLERLIDSTVDGIVAADMDGSIMVFNQGAARLFGYAPAQVIGKLPVWRLYPEGEAQRIMGQLRSPEHGGPGRLSASRRTVLGHDGAPIPVSLTAAIVYQDGREVATVGVLTDLRERLNIEQRLQQVQERLVVTEKHALIAELAGTAAHELNQPLTSVMGYAGLLRRRMADSGGDLLEFVETIVRESERMAEIVRKIGRITRYETKPYVGEARIIDLDKSAQPEPPAAFFRRLAEQGDKS